MPVTFTLDTNCIIAVDEGRPEAEAILELVRADSEGLASTALVAISASERQPGGGTLERFDQFKERLSSLGLGSLELLMPMLYWDVGFWDFGLWCDDEMAALEAKIHAILFPSIAIDHSEYCRQTGLDSSTTSMQTKWRNAKCDVQAFWSHAHHKRNVFVTSDKNFLAVSKRPILEALSGSQLFTPAQAVAILRRGAA